MPIVAAVPQKHRIISVKSLCSFPEPCWEMRLAEAGLGLGDNSSAQGSR